MGITSGGLQELGFTPDEDYILYDDGDGVYIKEWKSLSPQPSVPQIEAAEIVYDQKIQDSIAIKNSIMQTVATKIGKTVAELDEMHPVEIIYYMTEGN